MKSIGLEVGSGIFNKIYDSKEVFELIHIANYLPELKEKNKIKILTFLYCYKTSFFN